MAQRKRNRTRSSRKTSMKRNSKHSKARSQAPETKARPPDGSKAYETQLAERDKRIAELEAQVAGAAKTAQGI